MTQGKGVNKRAGRGWFCVKINSDLIKGAKYKYIIMADNP